MAYFEVKAQGDKMTFEAPDLADAKLQFRAFAGDVPESMLKWKEVKKAPADGVAADMREHTKPAAPKKAKKSK